MYISNGKKASTESTSISNGVTTVGAGPPPHLTPWPSGVASPEVFLCGQRQGRSQLWGHRGLDLGNFWPKYTSIMEKKVPWPSPRPSLLCLAKASNKSWLWEQSNFLCENVTEPTQNLSNYYSQGRRQKYLIAGGLRAVRSRDGGAEARRAEIIAAKYWGAHY